jgi:hypothetical protein
MPEDDRDAASDARASTASTRPRPRTRAGAVVVVVAAVTLLTTACHPRLPPLGGAGGCAVSWGSQPRIERALASAPVTAVRTGRHECFDRFVVDVAGPTGAGWDVRYVEAVREPGRGDVVTLRGGARLQLSVGAPAYVPVRQVVYQPADPDEAADVQGFDTFRQVAYLGSYEGRTSFGIGVRARLPFRVTALDGPGDGSRLVVDVAHRWS